MAKSNEKQILVYADWIELGAATFMGTLNATVVKGKEVFAFEYDSTWLKKYNTMYLDPNLGMYSGRQFLPEAKSNFGVFLDSSPDRWGRVLMKRREALMARNEGRKENPLFESDFLLGVFDKHRMGALRFKLDEKGAFLNDNKAFATPPWAALRDLEYASIQLEDEGRKDDKESLKWLNMLIAPGSSLGGARPKASVVDEKGNLWIAKFPSGNDDKDIGAWEMVLQQLASKVPDNADVYCYLALCLIMQKANYVEARKYLEKALDLSPENAVVCANLGTLIKDHFKEDDKAIEYFEKAIELNPQDANSYFSLAYINHTRNSNYTLARKYYEKSLELESGNSEAHYDFAILLNDHFKEYEKTRQQYEAAILHDANHSDAHCNLANLYKNQFSNVEKAKYHYETALNINPNDNLARKGLENLLHITSANGRNSLLSMAKNIFGK